MDNDAHELAVAVMRRLAAQDRKIEAQASEVKALRQEAVERREVQAQILEVMGTMGDTCQGIATAVARLNADLL